ncbi:MAG: tRNA (N6-threonylcarbamoyladenosine(37)-N6)-methyltransferase TrmO, partial [Solirubrobacteraceae bacterium]
MDASPAIAYRPIGVVRSPFVQPQGMPRQSIAAAAIRGQVEVLPELAPGLADLDGFSHLHLITHLHRSAPGGLRVVPFLDDSERGIFATRSPRHPNPIGLSVVRLLAVQGATLQIAGVDLVDDTPVLDIKPYVPEFDAIAAERTGWLQRAATRVRDTRYGSRMAQEPSLIVEVARDGAVARALAADPPAGVVDGVVIVEHGTPDAEGRLEAPAAGQIVLSVPSPEALARDVAAVHRVIAEAGTGVQPLVIVVEAADELRDEELRPVVD